VKTSVGHRSDDAEFSLVEVTANAKPERGPFGTFRFVRPRVVRGQQSPRPGCHDQDEALVGALAKPIAFMPPARSVMDRVPALPPNSVPDIVRDSNEFVSLAGGALGARVHRSVLLVEFEESTPRRARAAIIASVAGRVIGGEPSGPEGDGPYYVQVADDLVGDRILREGDWLARLPGVAGAMALSAISARGIGK
jgi:hypothetical protein